MPVLELGIMRHDINNPQKGQQLIDWAMTHGINHFESCWFYMNYQCEEYLYNKLQKYERNDYYICGKMPIHGIVAYQDFKEVFKTQLERVPSHYFDTYLLQAIDERAIYDIYQNDIINYFLQEKEKGTIKRFGLSIQCRPELFKKLLELKCWDVVQMPINYFDFYLCRYDENYNLAREYNIPIIAQAPVKGGLLVSPQKINSTHFPEGLSLIRAAFNFVRSLDGIEMILCGNSSVETLEHTYKVCNEKQLPISELYYKNAINEYRQLHTIQCIECGKCSLVCPNRLPVSAYVQLYNLALYDKTYFNAFDILKSAPDEPGHLCNNCHACELECPLSNDIPALLHSEIFELRT